MAAQGYTNVSVPTELVDAMDEFQRASGLSFRSPAHHASAAINAHMDPQAYVLRIIDAAEALHAQGDDVFHALRQCAYEQATAWRAPKAGTRGGG